ncbi:RHS repeat-associated core domain-containing protein [Comamonas odontotermitis]|uniref:RHS repeat-associated core domain-containing protein n=1 Tax=Comamonas odontotermitis TaxID=379895 RepID=UPI00366B0BF2
MAYGKIVTGSRTVLIGSQGGVACSVCPGGVTKGNPVNPQLGAKVLSGASELDFALPGAMPLVWQRQHSSYVNAGEGGYCGILGYGWGTPFELRISVQAGATLLHDSQGRTITFGALASGESIYSASEDIWLLRSGMHPGGLSQELASMTGAAKFTGLQGSADPETEANQPAPIPQGQQAPLWWRGRFAWIKRDIACSGLLILASTGSGDTLWVFAPANWQAIEAARAAVQKQQAAGKPITQNLAEVPEPDPNWILLGKMDRFGRMQRYHWSEVLGQPRITGINDGVGRHYQLHYQQILAAQDAQHYHHKDGNFFWQADSGVRLVGVSLSRDPTAPTPIVQPFPQPISLVRYTYSSAGDLVQVQDRHGETTRRFAWRNHLMVFHQDRSGPEHHYSYDRYEPGGKATEQRNQAGLDYRFDYQSLPEADGQPRRACVVTDSLGRVETYTFQGEAGLERLVQHIRADGSTIQNRYNQYGHLTGVTDPLGRSVSMRVSPMGQLLSVQRPDGAASFQRYDEDTGLLQSTTDAAGRTTGYEYDLYGRLIQVTLADGSTEQYHYPEAIGSTDASGITADPAIRLNADKPTRVTDAKGGSKHIAYTSAGQTASYTDCSGQSTRYEYTRWGQTLAVTNAAGERVRYQYNDKEQLEAIHYPDGSAEHYQYDAQGLVSQMQTGRQVNAAGNDGNAPIPASTTAASVSMEYDLWGRLVRRSHAGTSLGFAYDAAGRLTQLTNENGEHTTFAWDVMDRLAKETGFDARVQSYQYDAAGQLAQSSDGWAAEQGLPAHTSHYEWTAAGQLAARHLPAGEHTPAATHRYDWSKAGELLKASVWHGLADEAPASMPRLQSEALIERDAAGRVIGEVQRLYRQSSLASSSEPIVEFEHRISHRLDVLGYREASHLHGLGEVGYLLYGSGHVHGITWQGENLVDFERDALHRETGRQLATTLQSHGQQPLIRQLTWDKAGRLSAMQWSGLEQGTGLPDMLDTRAAASNLQGAHATRPPQAIVGALTSKHYHYDSLGQMVGIQSPAGLSRFAYDAAGRLTGADTPQAGLQRWKFDPAGNRLPIPAMAGSGQAPIPSDAITGELNETDRQRAQQRASSQANPVSREQIVHRDYNPLQGRPAQVNGQQSPVAQKWAGNRVAYYENSEDASSGGARTHYRYDSRGNRVESVDEATGRRMQLAYDKGNQLVQVRVQEEGKHFTQRYRYDAFGRRLAKYNDPGNEDASEEGGTDYFGWDGDRLVHTERLNSGNAKSSTDTPQPEVIHTVYEPGSFTPLIQLRRAAKAEPDLADELIAHMQPGIAQDALRGMFADIGATANKVNAGLGGLGMAADAQDFIREQLKGFEQTVNGQREASSKRVEIRHYLCGHLGTPNALVNDRGQIEWAAMLDALGNVKDEHCPKNLYQPIRLQGQHWDEESGLHYNRHRYYDSGLGRYLTQDPVGLRGGANKSSYPGDPISRIDPFGLQDFSGFDPGHDMQRQASLGMYMTQQGASKEEISQALYGKQDMPEKGSLAGGFGATAIFGVGISASSNVVAGHGKVCPAVTICGLIGLMAGGTVNASASLSTGTVTPGGSSWSIGGVGAAAVGFGGTTSVTISNSGNATLSAGPSMGAILGGGVKICRQKTADEDKCFIEK